MQDQDAQRIYRVNARSGKAVKVADDPRLDDSYDMTYDLGGNLIVAAGSGGVLRVNPRTGAISQFVPAMAPVAYIEGVGLEPPRCAGRVATITGTNRAEKITGSPKADVIAGMGGGDEIDGIGGGDVICGGPGKDNLAGGKGPDKLIGGPGKDRVSGGLGRDTCVGDRARRHGC